MVGGKTLVIIQVRTALIITSDKACTTLVGGGLIFHFGGSLVRFLQTRWLTRSRDGEDKWSFKHVQPPTITYNKAYLTMKGLVSTVVVP